MNKNKAVSPTTGQLDAETRAFIGRELERLHESYRVAQGEHRTRILDMIHKIHAMLFYPAVYIELDDRAKEMLK